MDIKNATVIVLRIQTLLEVTFLLNLFGSNTILAWMIYFRKNSTYVFDVPISYFKYTFKYSGRSKGEFGACFSRSKFFPFHVFSVNPSGVTTSSGEPLINHWYIYEVGNGIFCGFPGSIHQGGNIMSLNVFIVSRQSDVNIASIECTSVILCLKVTEELHTRPYMVTKKGASGQNISIGSFHASFHDDSIYVKLPQTLVMLWKTRRTHRYRDEYLPASSK